MVLATGNSGASMIESKSPLTSGDPSNMHLLFLLTFERCLKNGSDTFSWSDLASAWTLLMRCVQAKKSTSHQKGVFIHWIPDIALLNDTTTDALLMDADQCLALFETLVESVPQLESQNESLLVAFEKLKSDSNWKISPNEAHSSLLVTTSALIDDFKMKRMTHLKNALSLTDQISLQSYAAKLEEMKASLKSSTATVTERPKRPASPVSSSTRGMASPSLLPVESHSTHSSSRPSTPSQARPKSPGLKISTTTIEPATMDPLKEWTLLEPGSSVRSEQAPSREWKRCILFILREVSNHRHGTIFSTSVKEEEAPFYYEVVNRPLSLQIIKSKIRDDTLKTTEEVHRELLILFYNALVYNGPGTTIYDMASEMMDWTNSLMENFKQSKTTTDLTLNPMDAFIESPIEGQTMLEPTASTTLSVESMTEPADARKRARSSQMMFLEAKGGWMDEFLAMTRLQTPMTLY